MAGRDAYTVERARLLLALGENVRGLRKRRGLAQERLAEIASLHRNEIGVIERGQCEPGLLVLLVLADTLGVSLKELAEGVPAPRERRPARRPKGGGRERGGGGQAANA
jgi:transcriptional regulator with XRE-family HTH domain